MSPAPFISAERLAEDLNASVPKMPSDCVSEGLAPKVTWFLKLKFLIVVHLHFCIKCLLLLIDLKVFIYLFNTEKQAHLCYAEQRLYNSAG